MRIAVSWDDRFTQVFTNPSLRSAWTGRMKRFRSLLEETGLLECCVELVENGEAALEDLLLVHSPDYLEFLRRASESRWPAPIDYGDTYSYPGMMRDLLRLVGVEIKLLQGLVEGRWRIAYQPYGGLHHARRGAAAGFCPINDLAVVVEKARRLGFGRVAVVDVDAHHGDGTQAIFWDDPQVLHISIHAYAPGYFYPGTGSSHELGGPNARGTKLNLPLEPGTGDEAFQEAFQALIPRALELFRPDLLVAQLGVDGHRLDTLGILRLTTNTYRRVAETLATLAQNMGIPLIGFGGGGYGHRSAEAMIAEVAGFADALGTLPPSVEEKLEETVGEEETTDPPERKERLLTVVNKLLDELEKSV